MSHNSSPNITDPADNSQPSAEDARLMASLQALYSATEAPDALRQSGAEQIRLQFAARQRQRGSRGVFRALRSAAASGAGAHGRPQAVARPATIGALAAAALIILLAAALFGRPGLFTTRPAYNGAHGPHEPTPRVVSGPPVILTSVAMVSANDGWAFGSSQRGCLVLHYNGAAWSRDQASACAPATSISMLSAQDGWAVAYHTILRYTQGKWRLDSIYEPPGQDLSLNHIAMVSAHEGWIAGWANTPDGIPSALILHYVRGHWVPVSVSGLDTTRASSLRGIVMVSAQEGWAVGSQFTSDGETTLVLHYLDGRWTRLDWTMVGSFNGVAAFATGDVWMVGEDNAGAGPGLIVHMRRGAIIQTDRPIPGLLQNIAMVSPTDGWAVGDGAATVRYQNGAWTRQGLTIHQFYLMDVALVSASEGWAVGTTAVEENDLPGSNATLFHLSNGVWGIYPLTGV